MAFKIKNNYTDEFWTHNGHPVTFTMRRAAEEYRDQEVAASAAEGRPLDEDESLVVEVDAPLQAPTAPLQAYEAGGVYVDGGPFGGFYWAASQEDAMAQAQADMCTNSERTDETADYACLLTDQIATMVSFLADGPQP